MPPYFFMEISFCLHQYRRKLDVHVLNSQLPWLGKCQAYLSVLYVDLNFTRADTAKMTDYRLLQETALSLQRNCPSSRRSISSICKWGCDIQKWNDIRLELLDNWKQEQENNTWCVGSLCKQTWEMLGSTIQLTVGSYGVHMLHSNKELLVFSKEAKDL